MICYLAETRGLQPLSHLSYLKIRCISKKTLEYNLFKARIFNHPAPAFKNIVFERPIDTLSYYELNRNANALYITFGGQLAEGQFQTAKHLIEKLAGNSEVVKHICLKLGKGLREN